MARQPHDPDIMTEILPKLCADPHLPGELENFLLHLHIPEGLSERSAFLRQVVEIACRRQLHGLQVEFSGRAADDDGEVIGRTGRGSKRLIFSSRNVSIASLLRRAGSPGTSSCSQNRRLSR